MQTVTATRRSPGIVATGELAARDDVRSRWRRYAVMTASIPGLDPIKLSG